MPIKINSGVIRNPPPTPNIPDSIPVTPPKNNIKNILTGISAMGRYIYIITPKKSCRANTEHPQRIFP
jgi:hypothetical protein